MSHGRSLLTISEGSRSCVSRTMWRGKHVRAEVIGSALGQSYHAACESATTVKQRHKTMMCVGDNTGHRAARATRISVDAARAELCKHSIATTTAKQRAEALEGGLVHVRVVELLVAAFRKYRVRRAHGVPRVGGSGKGGPKVCHLVRLHRLDEDFALVGRQHIGKRLPRRDGFARGSGCKGA